MPFDAPTAAIRVGSYFLPPNTPADAIEIVAEQAQWENEWRRISEARERIRNGTASNQAVLNNLPDADLEDDPEDVAARDDSEWNALVDAEREAKQRAAAPFKGRLISFDPWPVGEPASMQQRNSAWQRRREPEGVYTMAPPAINAPQPSPASDAFPTDLLQVEGLLGEFVTECERSAPERRQPIYALAAAICVVGVLAGRRYRSDTDLRTNIYAAILGASSSGKGHAQRVALRLLHEACLSRYIAADYQSGNAIYSELTEHPALLAIVDEFGIWLAGLTGERTPKHLADIKKKLMTLFSSAADIVAGSGYADPKQRERKDIHQPHLCFLGVGTPEHFFKALQSGALRDGFVPRFLVFQPDELYPTLVANPQPLEISADMIRAAQEIADALPGDLSAILHTRSNEDQPARLVPFSVDGEAEHMRYVQRREDIIQGGHHGFHSQELVGKWKEHAIKLAMVRAISRNPAEPVMDALCINWGWRVAEWCIRTVNVMAERHLADNKVEADHKRLLEIIRKAGPDGIVKRELIRKTQFLVVKERDGIILALTEAEEIAAEVVPPGTKGGRTGFRYRVLTLPG